MNLKTFQCLGVAVFFGGCWVGDPKDVNPKLPDVDTLNECNEMKNECVGNKDGDIPVALKPKKYGSFHDIFLAGIKLAHGGKFALSALPPTGAGYIPYNPMMMRPMISPMGMYPMGYPMGMYPYGMYPMMGGMPMMYGPWW
ncbi:U1 small nuclear ribonucleoprotein [Helicobacter suis]|uniref:U1 small nuclear ribonucleoprotein n=1 Tax=Helicobacter suis TaxID=104628 RepID=UPI0013D1E53D|nr:U1 small nuclear ribonucleoprotein [Helicobacter suis]